MFSVMLELKEGEPVPTFLEAFRTLLEGIEKQLTRGTSWQVFETTNFLARTLPNGSCQVMNFYQAKDFAIIQEILVGKEISPDAKEPTEAELDQAFTLATAENMAAEIQDQLELLFLRAKSCIVELATPNSQN